MSQQGRGVGFRALGQQPQEPLLFAHGRCAPLFAGVLEELRGRSLRLDFQGRLPQFLGFRFCQALHQFREFGSLGSRQCVKRLNPKSDRLTWGTNAVGQQGGRHDQSLFENQTRQNQSQGGTGLGPKGFDEFCEELASRIRRARRQRSDSAFDPVQKGRGIPRGQRFQGLDPERFGRRGPLRVGAEATARGGGAQTEISAEGAAQNGFIRAVSEGVQAFSESR